MDLVVYRSCRPCEWRSDKRFPYVSEDKSTFQKFLDEGEKVCPKCQQAALGFTLEKVKQK